MSNRLSQASKVLTVAFFMFNFSAAAETSWTAKFDRKLTTFCASNRQQDGMEQFDGFWSRLGLNFGRKTKPQFKAADSPTGFHEFTMSSDCYKASLDRFAGNHKSVAFAEESNMLSSSNNIPVAYKSKLNAVRDELRIQMLRNVDASTFRGNHGRWQPSSEQDGDIEVFGGFVDQPLVFEVNLKAAAREFFLSNHHKLTKADQELSEVFGERETFCLADQSIFNRNRETNFKNRPRSLDNCGLGALALSNRMSVQFAVYGLMFLPVGLALVLLRASLLPAKA